MIVDVLWLSYRQDDGIIARGYWDQGMLEDLFAGNIWDTGSIEYNHVTSFDDIEGDGAVVILPARHHVDLVDRLNDDISGLDWVLLIAIGDEENAFPIGEVEHSNKRIYLMTPDFDKDLSNVDRFIGDGWPPDTGKFIASANSDPLDRPLDVFFSGQVNNDRRSKCVEALKRVPDGYVNETEGFTQGLDREEYIHKMLESKTVACPSGPATVDTFRFFEALECGCIPVADAISPHDSSYSGYWHKLFGFNDSPFPIVENWDSQAKAWDTLTVNPYWSELTIGCLSWWQDYKRELVMVLEDDLFSLTGIEPNGSGVTVVIPTSPIPSHPSTAIIEETISSIRDRLPDAEILIMVDGIRDEQSDRKADYEDYIISLLWKANNEWHNVLPVVFDKHTHQAAMLRDVIHKVCTPNILYVEHDTPLCGDIDFPGLLGAMSDNSVNVIRLHHETHVLDDHQHLMLDREPVEVKGVPLLRTAQWSQRPHLASVGFYGEILQKYFSDDCRTMIEDTMHGVVASPFESRGVSAWYDFKLWMYAPDLKDMKRSSNLDGRKDDEKFEMIP